MFSRLVVLFLLGMALCWLAVPSATMAQTPADPFTVRGIDVDVSASTPQAAKDQAILEAQRQGFRQLLERLTQPADYPRLPKADGKDHVRQFGVDNERSIGNRYRATLTVQFNGASVRRLLQGAGIAYAEPRSHILVVVPVFRDGQNRPVLWDEPNPWRAAWQSLGGGGLVPLFVPPGDVGDVQAISTEQAVSGHPGAMNAIAQRWRSQDSLVAFASLAGNGKALDVRLSAGPGVPKPYDSLVYSRQEGESAEALLRRAAKDISRALDTLHKQPNLVKLDQSGTLPVLAPLGGLEDWLALRDRLGRVAQVRQWELVSLSRAEAAILLHIAADEAALKQAMLLQGLALEQHDDLWSLKVRK